MSNNAGKPQTRAKVGSGLDELHDRIQAKLDELYSDFKQLEVDLAVSNEESRRARKDRIQGFKQALKDMLESTDRLEGLKKGARDLATSADRADREWS